MVHFITLTILITLDSVINLIFLFFIALIDIYVIPMRDLYVVYLSSERGASTQHFHIKKDTPKADLLIRMLPQWPLLTIECGIYFNVILINQHNDELIYIVY